MDLDTLRNAIGKELRETSDQRMRELIAKDQVPADWSDGFVVLTVEEVEDVRSQHPEVLVPNPKGHGYLSVLLFREDDA